MTNNSVSVRTACVHHMLNATPACAALLLLRRYTMLLSTQPAGGSCNGVYDIQYARITDSVRPHVATQQAICAPYPAWPSQDTLVNGTGLANALGEACPGASSAKAADCTGSRDPCAGQAACAEDSAVTCVPKACPGKYMVNNALLDPAVCRPVYISKITGLPVTSCDVTAQRLARQVRQGERRLDNTNSIGDGGAAAADGGGGGLLSRLLPAAGSQQQQRP